MKCRHAAILIGTCILAVAGCGNTTEPSTSAVTEVVNEEIETKTAETESEAEVEESLEAKVLSSEDVSDEAKKQAAELVAEMYGKGVETDLSKGTLMPYNGYYYGLVEMGKEYAVNGRTELRSYKQYIPEGLHRSMEYEVLLTVPDGWNTEQFLIASGWKDLADEHIFTLYILEPKDQKWGDEAYESSYIEQAFIHRLDATTSSSVYIAAYGTGGTYLQKYVLKQPMNIASAAYINASNIDASYYKETGETNLSAGNAAGSIGATTSEDNSKVSYGEIPVPVWIIDENLDSVQDAVDYWKSVDQTRDESTAASVGIENTVIYEQTDEIFYADSQEYDGQVYEFSHSATPDGLVANVLATEVEENVVNEEFTRSLYEDFLGNTFRYGSTIWSNILIEKPDYEAMGVDLLSLDYTVGEDTINREFLVYQPEGFAGDLPVVYIFPGGNQSHTNLFNATGWYRIAEENGIIIVAINGPAPFADKTGACSAYAWGSGTDYTGDELFMEKVMEYVNANYPTDETRVYTSGLWNFTRYFALNHPDVIAAQGSVSAWGSNDYKDAAAAESDLATFTMVGENDLGSPVIGETPDMVLDCLEKKDYDLDKLVMKQNIASDIDPRYNVNEYYLAGDNGEPTGNPIIRWGWVYDRGHSFLRTDYQIIWETWFSHWTVDLTTGKHIYTP